jgi:hypothetical protein
MRLSHRSILVRTYGTFESARRAGAACAGSGSSRRDAVSTRWSAQTCRATNAQSAQGRQCAGWLSSPCADTHVQQVEGQGAA